MTCIFCQNLVTGSSISHILPASLGGGTWACLPPGIVCDRCNWYFGKEVESRALASFPFLPLRVLLGIPTRKGSPPHMGTPLGTVRATVQPGTLGLDPATPAVEEALLNGRITELDIIAEPTEPAAVCRMLVKMGLEALASDLPDYARSPTFDSARDFARRPARGSSWWFLMHTDHPALFSRFRRGVSRAAWASRVNLSIQGSGEVILFRLQFLDVVIITPLDSRILPPCMDSFPEPEYRLFHGVI